jgi:hypothetical protein
MQQVTSPWDNGVSTRAPCVPPAPPPLAASADTTPLVLGVVFTVWGLGFRV